MRKMLLIAMVGALLPLPSVLSAQDAGAKPHASPITDESAVFAVRNTNTSALQCDADGRDYQVTARLVAPKKMPDAVTVYVPGGTGGGWQWGISSPSGFDHPVELAREGHASIVIDRLGHGSARQADSRPDGNAMCIGSEADVVHQIVGQLRSGEYLARGRPGPKFERVGLAGHSMGAAVAQVATYSYGDVDALILVGWASVFAPTEPTGFSEFAARIGPECDAAADGWITQWPSPEDQADDVYHDPDPAVVAATAELIEEESCGTLNSVIPAHMLDTALTATIDVPVLILNGEHDFFFDPAATRAQQHRYLASPDANAVVVPDAGHGFLIERTDTAAVLRALLGAWLERHGL